MYEVYYVKLQTIDEVSDRTAEQLKKFYKMFQEKEIWRNERGDVWLWVKTR